MLHRHRPAPAFPRGDVPIPPKILIVDDQEFVRYALRSLLVQQPHWEIYEAASGKAALESVREIKPDVVVMDIMMPEMSGIEAIYELRR